VHHSAHQHARVGTSIQLRSYHIHNWAYNTTDRLTAHHPARLTALLALLLLLLLLSLQLKVPKQPAVPCFNNHSTDRLVAVGDIASCYS
jgi:TorA maturation chaperone TorD